MPVYNAEKWLDKCIQSIRRQSLTNWELIAVDDFSMDNSLRVLESYSKKDHRVSVYSNSVKGIIPALQLAFNKSKGAFITRMDADDLMPANKLELLHNKLQENADSVVTGKVQYFSNREVSKGYQEYELWLNQCVTNQLFKQNMYRECTIASPNWMTSREVLKKVNPFSERVYPEDYDLVFRFIQHKIPIKGIKQVTHLWREHPHRTSRLSIEYNQHSFFQLKLKWFVTREVEKGDNVILFGKNAKSKLCQDILRVLKVKTTVIDFSNLKELETYSICKILVTVYPSVKERKEIEKFLHLKRYCWGKNWWYV